MQSELLTIFHFNDVYNIQPYNQQPKAGAAYFKSLLQRQRKKYHHKLTLFSGDAFSPSLLSCQFEGENMVKPLQSLGIDLACYGNHDLDYELEHVKDMTKRTGFPWLLTNIYDRRTGRRLAQGLQTYIIQKNGLKIGFFSLADKQWIDTLYPALYSNETCEYIPFVDCAVRMVYQLRNQQKCDMVIALTHMMKYNDIQLAKQVKGIDLIVGGHDHLIASQKINQTVLVKSGTDFKNFSIVKIQRNNDKRQKETSRLNNITRITCQKFTFQIELKEVNHELQKIQPDQQLNQYIQEIYKQFKVKQEKIACFTKKDIDLRFTTIRKEQSPYLEFLVSIYRHALNADIAMMNCGNFRMDAQIKAGPITNGVIENIITDRIVVKLMPAKILIQALEISISSYPNLAGRYMAFSGIGFSWDASKQPGERILVQTIKIHNKPIDMEKIYKVAMHSFVGDGGDGYGCLKGCKESQNEGQVYNRQLLHDLLHVHSYLIDTYVSKYPGRFKVIEFEGRNYLQLDLPEPKNVHMTMSSGHPYEGH